MECEQGMSGCEQRWGVNTPRCLFADTRSEARRLPHPIQHRGDTLIPVERIARNHQAALERVAERRREQQGSSGAVTAAAVAAAGGVEDRVSGGTSGRRVG